MDNKLHTPEQQLETLMLFWKLFEMLAQSTDHDAGKSYDDLSLPYQTYCEEQGLPQISCDELWHELHAKLYP